MNIFSRILGSMGYEKRVVKTPAKRGFAINSSSLLKMLGSASRSNTAIDFDLARSLEPMRAFSRDLSVNTSVGKRYLQLCATHIVGPNGFIPKWRPMNSANKLDKPAALALKAAFDDWSLPENCDIAGKLSFPEMQQLLVKTCARDGEFLVRRIVGRVNPYNYALQVLDVDRIDTNFNNTRLQNGNQVVMGVELTPYQRPVAMFLLRSHPGNTPTQTYTYSRHERVPMEELFHWFVPDRPEQTRGFPWTHAIMTDAKNMAGFIEAAIIASRIGASKMGFFSSPDGDGAAISDGEDDDGTLFTEAEPGKFGVLPPGWTFENFDPDYPNQMVESFLKVMMRFQAMGLGVAHHTLSGDLEGVNFSSARAGTLEERDEWMNKQGSFTRSFLDPLASDWLRFALLGNAVKLPSGTTLPATRMGKYDSASWQGRRWTWVDPAKDTEATLTLLQSGLTTFRRVMAERGDDLDEVWSELQDEIKMAKSMGIPIEQLWAAKTADQKPKAKETDSQPQPQE